MSRSGVESCGARWSDKENLDTRSTEKAYPCDGLEVLQELESLADALTLKASEHGRMASLERDASEARSEGALSTRLKALEAQVRALEEERKVLLDSARSRMQEALIIEKNAIETAIAASQRAQRLKQELERERTENTRLQEDLASAGEYLERTHNSIELETSRGLDVQMELAQRLERESGHRRDLEAQVSKLRESLNREETLHKKTRHKLKAQEDRLTQLEQVQMENEDLKVKTEEMKRLLRAVSSQKPLFDRIHRLQRKQETGR